MTNEEKAIQILRTIRGCWIPPIGAVFSPIDCIQAMMAMAEWRDQQFKEYLEEKLKKYKHGGRLIILDIINEFFGEE